MAEVIARRRVGTTDVEVTELGFGGASIGELFVPVTEHDALATIDAAWDVGHPLLRHGAVVRPGALGAANRQRPP